MEHTVEAFLLGLSDGYAYGESISMGLTWADDQDKNEAYDHGLTLGQALHEAAR